MKKFLRRNPIGDHCIYTDTGLEQKHGDSGWIYLCTGDLERVKEAVRLMEQWKGEYAPYSR